MSQPLGPNYELRVQILAAQLEEAGWDYAGADAVLLACVLTANKKMNEKERRNLQRAVMQIRTTHEWARTWILLAEQYAGDGFLAYSAR